MARLPDDVVAAITKLVNAQTKSNEERFARLESAILQLTNGSVGSFTPVQL